MQPFVIRRPPWPLAAATLALLVGAGCLPNPSWLPDSSGFVYTGGPRGDQLILYDTVKGEARVLGDANAGPAWPAVSPDGKRIAVAVRHGQDPDMTLEVAVFDRDGKELHRSKPTDWKSGMPLLIAQAAWAPAGDRLLVWDYYVTGIYGVEAGTWTKVDALPAAFGATPIRPDGKGFLGCKSKHSVNPRCESCGGGWLRAA